MRKSSSSASGVGDLAICALFFLLALLAGVLVVTLLLVATAPVVSIFPPESGAKEIVLGISLLWGVVTGCVVAVFTIGPWRRLRARAQIESVDDADSLPLELIGRPLPRRRVANDARRRAAANDAHGVEDEEDALSLDEAEELPRRYAGRRSPRRA
ncbi:MAG TPA: hypothetical protein VGP48_10635 [Stellaceae bacterium]|jgi:hypothetical protein|nr:hypothetical protein [Stellaceae bacterium]